MPDLARTIVSRMRELLGNRRHLKRRPARLPFSVRLANRQNGARRVPSLEGQTLDVSNTGMALNVSAIRIGEHYLVGDNRRLQIRLELPFGPVEMQAVPVRYESIEDEQIEIGYVIGVKITEMSENDRVRFDKYVKSLSNSGHRD